MDDLDRPLNKRGRETAKTIAAYLRRAKITPDLVLCSTAVRAKQTLEPIANAIIAHRLGRDHGEVRDKIAEVGRACW